MDTPPKPATAFQFLHPSSPLGVDALACASFVCRTSSSVGGKRGWSSWRWQLSTLNLHAEMTNMLADNDGEGQERLRCPSLGQQWRLGWALPTVNLLGLVHYLEAGVLDPKGRPNI